MQLNRRNAIVMSLAAATMSLAGTRAAGALADRLHIIIGQPGATNADIVDRAFAAAIQTLNPSLPVDIENAGGSSGRAAFKTIVASTGNPGLLGMIQNGLLYGLLTEEAEGLGQFNQLALLGALGREQRAVMVTRASGIGSMAGLLARAEPVILPTINATSSNAIESLLVNFLTGSRIKPVPGFSGGERRLALISGEGQAVAGSVVSFSDMIEDGSLIPIVRLNDIGPATTDPDVPLLAEFARTDEAAGLASLVQAVADVPQLVVAPPGLAESDVTELSVLMDAAAAKLQERPPPGYTKDDMVWSPRNIAVATLRAIAAQPDIGPTLARAIACGQTLGDGGSCP